MENPKIHKRPPLLVPALVILAALIAVYLPIRSRTAGTGLSREGPPRDSALSIFLTNQLAGYREPCG